MQCWEGGIDHTLTTTKVTNVGGADNAPRQVRRRHHNRNLQSYNKEKQTRIASAALGTYNYDYPRGGGKPMQAGPTTLASACWRRSSCGHTRRAPPRSVLAVLGLRPGLPRIAALRARGGQTKTATSSPVAAAAEQKQQQ